MTIKPHFQITLNPDQENTVGKLETFLDSNDRVFLLKGYAGTGKTTLIRGLISALAVEKKRFVVCAPTGRAAKILRSKTGHGATIHSTIYDFNNLVTKNAESKDLAEHSFEYFFPVVKLEEDTVIIVDEASMISSRLSKNELFTFGTDILLDDLLTFAQLQMSGNRNKMIVIGDPAQLPPVGDNTSWALEESYYREREIPFTEVFLTQVMRQEKNLILENAFRIRRCIDHPRERILEFKTDDSTFIDFNNKDVVEKYCELYTVPDFDSGVIITFSNAQNWWYNREIRENLFPGKPHISEGDLVQIISNNYSKYPVRIYNGEFAQIVHVDHQTVKQSAAVMVDQAGSRKRKIIEMTFRKVVFRLPDFGDELIGYINETILESTARDLTIDEMKALYINLVMRYRKEFPGRAIGSEHFKNYMQTDDFFNALRVKYGYSITGHKSQGGEWKTVFVDYFGRVSLKKDPLRWCYTATTRASERLFAVNYPHFGKYFKLNFSPPAVISKFPADAQDFSKVPVTPFHRESDHRCKSLLYWNILEKCEDTDVTVEKVDAFDYCEKYTFRHLGAEVKAEVYHNLAGFFRPFSFVSGEAPDIIAVKEMLAKENSVFFPVEYKASEEFLEDLHTLIQASCNDLNIRITNIAEKKDNYFVNYFFETDNPCAQLQFYWNGRQEITRILVRTFGTAKDGKLNLLTAKIKEYASVPAN